MPLSIVPSSCIAQLCSWTIVFCYRRIDMPISISDWEWNEITWKITAVSCPYMPIAGPNHNRLPLRNCKFGSDTNCASYFPIKISFARPHSLDCSSRRRTSSFIPKIFSGRTKPIKIQRRGNWVNWHREKQNPKNERWGEREEEKEKSRLHMCSPFSVLHCVQTTIRIRRQRTNAHISYLKRMALCMCCTRVCEWMSVFDLTIMMIIMMLISSITYTKTKSEKGNLLCVCVCVGIAKWNTKCVLCVWVHKLFFKKNERRRSAKK